MDVLTWSDWFRRFNNLDCEWLTRIQLSVGARIGLAIVILAIFVERVPLKLLIYTKKELRMNDFAIFRRIIH